MISETAQHSGPTSPSATITPISVPFFQTVMLFCVELPLPLLILAGRCCYGCTSCPTEERLPDLSVVRSAAWRVGEVSRMPAFPPSCPVTLIYWSRVKKGERSNATSTGWAVALGSKWHCWCTKMRHVTLHTPAPRLRCLAPSSRTRAARRGRLSGRQHHWRWRSRR